MIEAMESGRGSHFVLVHGMCHGAWCWYKLVPLLKSSGHRVSAVDLSGCGRDPRRTEDVATISDLVRPLMEVMRSVREDEKVILVGHSYGGMAVALAMESFPEKVSVAVFLSAYMPDYCSPPATYIYEYFKRKKQESLLDCEVTFDGGLQKPPTSAIFGPKYIETKAYLHCPPEDVELGKMLVRPGRHFVEDLGQESMLTRERFGSVNRVFVICEEDEIVEEEFQKWMIQKASSAAAPAKVKAIAKAGHMAMLSKPNELSLCFQEIAAEYQ